MHFPQCSRCMAAHLGLGLKPILIRITPECAPLQEQLVSALADLLLCHPRNRERLLMSIRLVGGSLLRTGTVWRNGRI